MTPHPRPAVPTARALLLRRAPHDFVDGAEDFAAPPPVGVLLAGRWMLQERVARTPATATFRAWDRLERQSVRVRVVLPPVDDPAGLARAVMVLLHEQVDRALAVDHPNAVRLLARAVDGVYELVVEEAVEGTDAGCLRAAQPDGRLDAEAVVGLGLDALAALDAAHRAGAVHGHLRPASLIVREDGACKVHGIGLAALAYLDSGGRGLLDCALRYAAPEVVTRAAADARSDLYALAGTLFALGEGASPFGPTMAEAVRGNLDHPAPMGRHLPRAVERVLHRALEKDPDARFASATEMWTALDEAAAIARGPRVIVGGVDDALVLEAEPAPAAPDAATFTVFSARASDDGDVARVVLPVDREPAPAPRRATPLPDDMAAISARRVKSGGETWSIPAFRIDRAPVTNAQWAAYVRATGDATPDHWTGGKPPPGTERHPVVGVPLAAARRYATWKGRRLPTVTEWMSVVLGPEGERRFPWGQTCEGNRCNCPRQRPETTAPVDAHADAATPEGVVDLYGNVWEWTEPEDRLPTPEAAQAWVLGGSFRHPCTAPRGVPKSAVGIGKAYLYLGFRCAADEGAG